MTTEQMREALKDVYMSQNWRDKVAAMPKSQVFVVYTKMKMEGKVQ